MGQSNKTFYCGNLLSFHGNYRGNIALSHKMNSIDMDWC